jgi:hypothetical protein
MTITAFSGPTVSFGTVLTSTSGDGITGQDLEHNEQRAPSFSDLGDALMDPRSAYMYQPGSGVTVKTLGFFNNTGIVDYIPLAINSSAFVVNTASSGVSTFTLTSGISSNGTFATTIIAPETGKATGTLIAVDSTAAFLTFGSAGTMAVWNPAAGTGRNITIKPSSNLDGGTYTIAGRDMYGYKMTETIAGGSTNLAGKKAFKYVSSITNASSPTSTGILVGFGDIYGFPLQVPYAGLNAQIAIIPTAFGSTVSIVNLPSSVNTVLASTVSVQTSTTPDVRGTYASTTASNGTLRLQIVIAPPATTLAAITSTNVAPLFGATQFSSV